MITVIIHCSDSEWGNAAEITRWHSLPQPRGRGWSTIGYHYVILNGQLSPDHYHHLYDGHLETGRPLDDDRDIQRDEWGAHAIGYNNTVGVCLIGKSGEFTSRQRLKLFFLFMDLEEQYKDIQVIQHSDVDPVNKPHCAGLSQDIIDYFN